MKTENFASVQTIARYNLVYLEAEERKVFEDYRYSLNGFPLYLQEKKKYLVAYNPTLAFLQHEHWFLDETLQYNFEKFEFIKLNFQDFSYNILSLVENAEWLDFVRNNEPVDNLFIEPQEDAPQCPPKYIVANTIHVKTNARDLQDFYAKISDEKMLALPIPTHAKKIEKYVVQRVKQLKLEQTPQQLYQDYFSENIPDWERWRQQRHLFGRDFCLKSIGDIARFL